jgi:hypothetical protein
MECSNYRKDKKPIANKPPNSYPFVFLHLEIEKPPLYVGNIWVLTLLVDFGRSVKIYVLGLEKCFQFGDRLIKVEHASVTS